MVVPLIGAGVVAVVFLALWVTTRQKLGGVQGELSDAETQLTVAKSEVASMNSELDMTNSELDTTKDAVKCLQAKSDGLESELSGTSARLDDANDTLRKRTELADAQALQIDALSGERDELREEIRQADEKMASMAARPGLVVGDVVDGVSSGEAEGGTQFETLWNLELARTERVWRNSVAIDPTSETSPLDDSDNVLRQAIEIEAAALREDVGALIDVEWKAGTVESSARRLMVLRLAQEMLASAARAPGATSLVISGGDPGADPDTSSPASADGDTGGSEIGGSEIGGSGIRLEFTSVQADVEGINLIPPAVTGPAFEGVLDIRREGSAAVVLTAPTSVAGPRDKAASGQKA